MTEPREYGTDTSGRPVLMTPYMAHWYEGLVFRLGWRPTIVQGAWMARLGGGADASEGYHDGGGCLDLRVWDLPGQRQRELVLACRAGGAAAWLRDRVHGGMDPHLHLVLGTDSGLAAGVAWQWREYLAGRDGLASRGLDYHPRPDPLVTTPPEDWPMPTVDEIAAAVRDLEIQTEDGPQRVGRVLARIYNRQLDPAGLAAAIAAKLPAVPAPDVESAVRAALQDLTLTVKEK